MPNPIAPFPPKFMPDSYQLADRYQLGSLTDVFPARPWLGNQAAIILSLILLFFAAIATTGVMIFLVVAFLMSSTQEMIFSLFGFIMMGLILLLGTIPTFLWMLAIRFYRHSKSRVLLGSEGIAYLYGKRATIIRWPEIEHIKMRTGSSEKLPSCCHLLLTNGKTIKFGHYFYNISHLSRTIARRVTRAQMPQLFSAYHTGQTLTFGPLSLNKRGLHKGKESLSWEQFTMLYVYEGVVTVEQDGKHRLWPLVKVSRIPDFFSFIALIHLITDGRIRYEPPDPS